MTSYTPWLLVTLISSGISMGFTPLRVKEILLESSGKRAFLRFLGWYQKTVHCPELE